MFLTEFDINKALEELENTGYKDHLLRLIKDNQATVTPIVTHAKADGDAIASAVSIQKTMNLLAESKELECNTVIVTPQGVVDPQNQAMVTLGEIAILESLPTRHGPAVLVDASSPKQSNVGLNNLKVRIAIDPGHQSEPEDNILLIGENAGATCTITALMYMKAKMDIEGLASPLNVDVDPILATLIYFGIAQDTNDLSAERTTNLDRWVHDSAYLNRDSSTFQRIKKYPIPRSSRLIKQHGLNHLKEHGSLIVSCLGWIREAHESLVARAAEKRCREEQARKVVVFGIIDEEDRDPVIRGSVRTDLDTSHTVSDTAGIFPQSGGAQGMTGGIEELGYRGDLIRLASDDKEGAGPETEVLGALVLKLLKKWKDAESIPEAFKTSSQAPGLDEFLRDERRAVGKDEDEQWETVLNWLSHHREIWAEARKEKEGGESEWPSQEELLAELSREASGEREGTPREVMESLIFRQITRRARSVFDEEK